MEIPRQKRAWVQVLVVAWGLSLSAGAATPSFAADAPAPPTLTLAGDPAIAFQGGYIKFSEQVSGLVVGSREYKQLFGMGDVLYVRVLPDANVKVGDRLTLYRPTKQVYHPVTRAPLGQIMVVLGILQVATESKENVVSTRIERAFESIEPGDLVMPFQLPPEVPAKQTTSGPLTGVIVDFKQAREVTAQSEIIYIDRGETDGVALGDRFSVIRPGRRLSFMTKNPDEVLAEIKIIGMQPRTATAYVVKSTDAIHRGDIVSRMPPPPSQPSPPSPVKEAPKAEGAPPTVAKVTPSEAPALPPSKALEDVYFDFDKWALTDQAKKTLTAQAELLKQNATATITIEGYADERGSTEYNRILGEKRALEVRRFLTEFGVSNPFTVISFGKDKPFCTEKDEACYTQNRRVRLLVSGN
jgi:outer membrane protein OmpA-like peptidoglycan-associated protein